MHIDRSQVNENKPTLEAPASGFVSKSVVLRPVDTPSVPRASLSETSGKPAIKNIESKAGFTKFELENGLRVIFKKTNNPQISGHLVLDSGSSNDPEGKEGIAHFLEHMTIQHTGEFKDALIPFVERTGGYINAVTRPKQTIYDLTLPKDKLGLALKIFRAYLSPLNFNEAEVQREVSVIEKEIRRIKSKSSIRKEDKIQAILHSPGSKFLRPSLGSEASVSSISKEHLNAAHKSAYAPNNATLVISGDLDEGDLKAKVVSSFSALRRDLESSPTIETETIVGPSETEHQINDASLVPSLDFAFKLPEDHSPHDNLVMSLISIALLGTENSRLQQKLIYGSEGDSSDSVLHIQGGKLNEAYYVINLRLLNGEVDNANLKGIEELVKTELEDIAENGLKKEELQRIIRRSENKEIYDQVSPSANLKEVISSLALGERTWDSSLDKLNDLRTITNDDIKAVANKCLQWKGRYLIHSTGKGEALETVNLGETNPESMEFEEAVADLSPLDRVRAFAGDYSNIPLSLRSLQKMQVGSTEVFLKEDHSVPLLYSRVSFDSNCASVDRKIEDGFLLLERLLLGGIYNPETKEELNRKELFEKFEDLGLKLQLDLGVNDSGINLSMLTDHFEASRDLLTEVLNHSVLLETEDSAILHRLEKEFTALKKMLTNYLIEDEKDPAVILDGEFSRLVSSRGDTLYQEPLAERIRDIEALKLSDMRDLYQKVFNGTMARVSLVGDLDRKKATKFVSVFDDLSNKTKWTNGAISTPVVEEPSSPVLKIVETDKHQKESLIKIGNTVSIKETDPDFQHALLANLVLGNDISSRLPTLIRMERGLVYSINSSFLSAINESGLFFVQLACKPEQTAEVTKLLLDSIEDFVERGITEEELDLAKSRLKSRAAMLSLSNLPSTCMTFANLQLTNRDDKYINALSEQIDSITAERVNAAIKKLVKPKQFTMLVTKPENAELPCELAESLQARGYRNANT